MVRAEGALGVESVIVDKEVVGVNEAVIAEETIGAEDTTIGVVGAEEENCVDYSHRNVLRKQEF